MSVTLRSVGRWKRDSEVSACEACATKFGFVTRRHHCRSCGGIYCSGCSENSLVIELVDPATPQRVCTACYHRAVCPPVAQIPAALLSQAPPSTASKPSQPANEKVNPFYSSPSCAAETDPSGATEAKNQRESASPPPSCHNASESDSDDDFDRPLDMASRLASALVSSHCIPSTQNLSFLSVLQDGLKKADAGNVLNILIFASAERQQAMVVTVEPSETMGDIAARLTEMYFKLENPPFKKMTPEAAASLRERLRFTSEFQVIDPATDASSVVAHCRNVILSAVPPDVVAQLCRGNAASERSLREFWRSERSDNHDEPVADPSW